ncbi:hypothetical protein CMESO_264 (nucleomorph) [Chroomonas mesostigmatica CCMP1168]|uniref:Uncharacterized protein n=1 Tax=Chroomonas mesostigmatica CCMP1168 TaxID=1195612 RepID=J7G5T3_9CRYP|nr:hypothetical protein CMESO_264 [Chroomonas mesostigmatica CCMP1168]
MTTFSKTNLQRKIKKMAQSNRKRYIGFFFIKKVKKNNYLSLCFSLLFCNNFFFIFGEIF